MLFEVNFSDNKFILGNDVFEIKRGQSCNSLRTWGKIFNANPKTVQEFFKLLKKDHMISYKTIGKGKQSTTLVTIENYNDYQSEVKHKLPRKGNIKETQGKHELDTIEQGNNVNKENNVYREFAHLSISVEQFEKLNLQFPKDKIDHILNKIENFKDKKKYTDLYLTALNWLKDDQIKFTTNQTAAPSFPR